MRYKWEALVSLIMAIGLNIAVLATNNFNQCFSYNTTIVVWGVCGFLVIFYSMSAAYVAMLIADYGPARAAEPPCAVALLELGIMSLCVTIGILGHSGDSIRGGDTTACLLLASVVGPFSFFIITACIQRYCCGAVNAILIGCDCCTEQHDEEQGVVMSGL